MLTPHINDKNRKNELKRSDSNPESFGGGSHATGFKKKYPKDWKSGGGLKEGQPQIVEGKIREIMARENLDRAVAETFYGYMEHTGINDFDLAREELIKIGVIKTKIVRNEK